MKRLACKLVRLPQLAVVGFERPEACHHPSSQIRLRLFPAGTFVFLSAKRSRCTKHKALVSVPLPGRLDALPPPFPENFAGMQRHAQAALNTAQQ